MHAMARLATASSSTAPPRLLCQLGYPYGGEIVAFDVDGQGLRLCHKAELCALA
jgi:hypothetical protein